MNTMTWLLRREMWEHKGALLWTPLIAGLVILVALLCGMGAALYFGDGNFVISGASVGSLARDISASEQTAFASGLSREYISVGGPIFLLLGIMVFFFSLSALSDEIKDRSVLFWKSMPVSDGKTVLSKTLTALLVAPLIFAGVATLLGLATLFLILLFGFSYGLNLFDDVFFQSDAYMAPLRLLSIIPVYALWALPAVGWLMLVGALAPRKPFLWAVLLPVMAGMIVSWVSMALGTHDGWFWSNVVGRMLFSVVPGSWLAFSGDFNGSSGLMVELVERSWGMLLTTQLWVGALAGCLMLLAAAKVRRWKDEG